MRKDLFDIDKEKKTSDADIEPFEYTLSNVQVKKYLSYIHEWNGLTQSSELSDNIVYKEYQNKSRNWLNGRRSKKYGNTLFHDIFRLCTEV